MSYGCSNITLLTRMYRLFGKYVSFMSNLFETTWLSLEKKGDLELLIFQTLNEAL